MHMCWGCLHPFTESNVQSLCIEGGLQSLFQDVRVNISSLSELKPQSTKLSKVAATLQEAFNTLASQVHQEIHDLQASLAMLHSERELANAAAAEARKRTVELHNSIRDDSTTRHVRTKGATVRSPKAQKPQHKAHSVSSEEPTVRTNSRGTKYTKFNPKQTQRVVTNRFGQQVSGPKLSRQRGVAPAVGVGVQIMSALYLVAESVAEQVGASRAVLWGRVQGALLSEAGDEIVPLVCMGNFSVSGKEEPTRRPLSQGVVGAVVGTGVGVNVGVEQRAPAHTQGTTGSESVAEAVVTNLKTLKSDEEGGGEPKVSDQDMPTTLLVPIPVRFKAYVRECIGAIQLFDKVGAPGTCFSEYDEATALSGASVISHILSNFKDSFQAPPRPIDQPLSSNVPFTPHDAAAAVPSAVSTQYPPLLMHRAGTLAAVTRGTLVRSNKEVALQGRVKEVDRFQSTLEIAWRQSVALLSESENKRQALMLNVAELRSELSTSRQQTRTFMSQCEELQQMQQSAKHPAPPNRRESSPIRRPHSASPCVSKAFLEADQRRGGGGGGARERVASTAGHLQPPAGTVRRSPSRGASCVSFSG